MIFVSCERTYWCSIKILVLLPHRFSVTPYGLATIAHPRSIIFVLCKKQYATSYYKIVFGLISINVADYFEVCSVSTRGHPYKLFKPFSGCTSRSSFFSMRVINVWNDLPTDVVNFRTLESFKRTIQLVDLSNYLTSSSNQ